MSEPGTPNGRPQDSHDSPAPPALELDTSKLHSLPSEQQDLFLLSFIADLVRHVQKLPAEAFPLQQTTIKKQLIVVLNLQSPIPSRPVRNSLASVYVELFTRGTRSLLFESITELLELINAPKGEKELRNKHAAVVCLGQILESAGDSAISFCGITITSLLKLLKQSQNYTGLRAAIYKALGCAVLGFGQSVDEQYARDIWKSARGAVSGEKAFLPQRMACKCLETLITTTSFFSNANDYDSLKSTAWKGIESPIPVVRHSAASLLAAAFTKHFSQSEAGSTAPKLAKASKKAKSGLNGTEETERRSFSSPRSAPQPLTLDLLEILNTLSSQYTRPATNDRCRAGIAVCYRYVFLRLPSSVVEESYSLIASHLFNSLINYPTVVQDRYRLLLTRRFVKAILDDTIGIKILNETAQLSAVRWLLNDTLKNYPRSISERAEPPKQVIIAALNSLSNFLSYLGPAVGTVAELCCETLLQVIQHPSHTVQVHVCKCLRIYALACPQQMLPCMEQCLELMGKTLSRLTENRLFQRRAIGYATALAAFAGCSRSQPLYGSVDVFSRILHEATELLKASSSSELRVSATQVQVAWILIGGLMPLGPNFVKIHLPQLLLLWKNALPKPLPQDTSAKRGALELSFLAHVRECALSALLIFLEYNGSLLTTDSSKRVATLLQNTIAFVEGLGRRRQTEEIANRLITALQLPDFQIMVQRRILQCFTRLISLQHLGGADISLHANLLSLAINSLAEPESDSSRSSSAMAINLTSFESLWVLADNWGFGVTGYTTGDCARVLSRDTGRRSLGDFGSLDTEPGIDELVGSLPCLVFQCTDKTGYLAFGKGSRA